MQRILEKDFVNSGYLPSPLEFSDGNYFHADSGFVGGHLWFISIGTGFKTYADGFVVNRSYYYEMFEKSI